MSGNRRIDKHCKEICYAPSSTMGPFEPANQRCQRCKLDSVEASPLKVMPSLTNDVGVAQT